MMNMMRSRLISSIKAINRIQSKQLSILIENYRSSWPDQLYMINKKLTLNPKLSEHFDNVVNNNISDSIDSIINADNHNTNEDGSSSSNNSKTISKTFLPKRTIDPDLLTFQFTTNFTRGTSFFYSHLDLHPGDYKVVLLVMMMMMMMMMMLLMMMSIM